ncbi:MAG: hypothetical protein WC058_15600 [Phycisphaeraceae bacterium]
MRDQPLLPIRDLVVSFRTERGAVRAVNDPPIRRSACTETGMIPPPVADTIEYPISHRASPD